MTSHGSPGWFDVVCQGSVSFGRCLNRERVKENGLKGHYVAKRKTKEKDTKVRVCVAVEMNASGERQRRRKQFVVSWETTICDGELDIESDEGNPRQRKRQGHEVVHENMYHCSSRAEWIVALVESEKCTRHQGAREVTHVTAACGAALQTAIARNETGHELTTNVLKDKNTKQTDVERRRRDTESTGDKEEVHEIVKVEVQVIRRFIIGHSLLEAEPNWMECSEH